MESFQNKGSHFKIASVGIGSKSFQMTLDSLQNILKRLWSHFSMGVAWKCYTGLILGGGAVGCHKDSLRLHWRRQGRKTWNFLKFQLYSHVSVWKHSGRYSASDYRTIQLQFEGITHIRLKLNLYISVPGGGGGDFIPVKMLTNHLFNATQSINQIIWHLILMTCK